MMCVMHMRVTPNYLQWLADLQCICGSELMIAEMHARLNRCISACDLCMPKCRVAMHLSVSSL